MTDDYIIVSSNSGLSGDSRKLHTDEDCHLLDNSRRAREPTEYEAQHFEMCPACDGEKWQGKVDQDMSYQKALKQAAEENRE